MSFPCWLFFPAFLFFEVLVIFAVFPVTSPSESFCLEKPVAEVAFLNHVSMILAAVQIGAGGGRFYHFLAVFQPFVVRIVEGVDVYGQSPSVLRYRMGMRDEAEVEAGGVVGSHRPFVVGIPVVNESHPFYRIFCLVELFQNVEHICGYCPVHHHLSYDVSAVLVYVQASYVSQFASCHGTVLLVCLALHQAEDIIRNSGDGEEMLLAQFPDGLRTDVFSRLLCLGWEAEKSGKQQAYHQYLFCFHHVSPYFATGI